MTMLQAMLALGKRAAIRAATVVCICGRAVSLLAQTHDVSPQLQVDFLKVIEDARQMYSAGQTDLQRGAARPVRAKALCALLAGQRVEGWVGTVDGLTTNSEGRGVISIDVGQRIYLKTYNNAFSDYGHDTMLDPNGRLFAIATSLKKGDKVTFSGAFLRGDKDCIMEASLTISGSIREPWFIFRFAHLVKR